jgi:hypothetical protein
MFLELGNVRDDLFGNELFDGFPEQALIVVDICGCENVLGSRGCN